MKKNIFFLLGLFLILSQVSVKAEPIKREIREEIRFKIRNEIKPTVLPTIRVIKETLKNSGSMPAQIRKETKEKNKGLLKQIENRVREITTGKLKFVSRLTGKISAIVGNQLTISDNEGKSYSVFGAERTQLRRRFWGKSSLDEFKVGDEVNVIGRYTNEEKTQIEAVLIRNLSIQKRWGIFFGEVVSLTTNSLVIKTNKRGQLTVYLTSATKIINRKEDQINLSDIKVGHRIRIKGVWDKDLKEIRETDEIKDFSLPPMATPAAIQ